MPAGHVEGEPAPGVSQRCVTMALATILWPVLLQSQDFEFGPLTRIATDEQAYPA